ncbi:pyridoxal phosphate-dependent aminotransferase [Nonomuraea sp. NPDC050786]|uniref:pyridoxal phosphate-dependent aminotransferase n=1 Tax=Nonomuraea sp. NPDC050786 TaxID=3154840 RepID=UPI00340FAC20
MQLFSAAPVARRIDVPAEARGVVSRLRDVGSDPGIFLPAVDERVLEVFRRARNPEDPIELRDLWLGRVEHERGPQSHRRAWFAEQWRSSVVRRRADAEEVLKSHATVRFVKELFNWFFRDDLYGELRESAQVILSGGSVDELNWGLPETLKECVRYALDRDWYGYSDSCGRVQARQAVAAYESARIEGASYEAGNIALSMGGTFAISTLADFVLTGHSHRVSPALCATPNYPPLVEAIARRGDVQLVPLPSIAGRMLLEPLIEALTPQTPLVLVQTAANPTGAAVDEEDLARLVRAASPSTIVLLDECHEWLGEPRTLSSWRAASNVVRVSSLSKNWSAPGMKAGWIVANTSFISDYYEYASTNFGGPPSFLYTLVEVLARMERWMITDTTRLGMAELGEFEQTYGLSLLRLQAAYDSYCKERRAREQSLHLLRDAAVLELSQVAMTYRPHYSINVLVHFEQWDDSYRCFRDLLCETGISVYPGILNFCFSGGVVRFTTARPWKDLELATARLRDLIATREAVHA